jgi:hypothetical protein
LLSKKILLIHRNAFIASQASAGSSTQKLSYDYFDTRPLAGISYYRLQQINLDGKITYSTIARVIFGHGGSAFIIYPNPAKNIITIEGLKGNESIQLYSTTGQLFKNEKAGGPALILDISEIAVGVYRVTITDSNGNRTTQKILKE